MTKYVKTDYVPEDCDYLTAVKVYEVVEEIFHVSCAIIKIDDGTKNIIHYDSCSYLDERPWTVWEE